MDVLTVSSKGQISIPAKVRNEMGIKQGDKLAYLILDDTMVIKPIKMPSMKEFKESLDEAQEWAESVGYTEDDVNDIIKSTRARKRKAE